MPLAARLLLAFGVVAIIATALVGLTLREASRDIIESGFADRIRAAHAGVEQQLAWEVGALRDLLPPLCRHDTFVDKALVALERAKGDPAAMDSGDRIALPRQVAEQAKALRLDELSLVAGNGRVLGDVDVARVGVLDRRLAALIKSPGGAPRLRPAAGGEPSLEVHCARESNGVTIGLVGARRIDPILARIGAAYGVRLTVAGEGRPAPASGPAEVVRSLEFAEIPGLRVVASLSREPLREALARLDQSIAATGATVLALALAVAFVLARSFSRPIVALAHETREVMSGAPRKVEGRGGREIAALAAAFNATLDELAAMRKRLAATERIAARREVARQIAHEIKNPLAPIRAAVETLRRLRQRDDPAFDDYFEEATSTVLTEVHRIANIVTEFTRFARLPPPNLMPTDLVAVARGVVTLHAAPDNGADATGDAGGADATGGASEAGATGDTADAAASGALPRSRAAKGGAGRPRVELVAEPIPMISADRDQLVQVLTNLVQNGLEAASAIRSDPRVVVTVGPLPNDRVRIVVRDNGPGVAEEMAPRLFEPYATTKEKGTGLGLAIAQRIVFEHGGEISYRKATKGGAVFEIWLPVAGPPLLEKPLGDTTVRPRGADAP